MGGHESEGEWRGGGVRGRRESSRAVPEAFPSRAMGPLDLAGSCWDMPLWRRASVAATRFVKRFDLYRATNCAHVSWGSPTFRCRDPKGRTIPDIRMSG